MDVETWKFDGKNIIKWGNYRMNEECPYGKTNDWQHHTKSCTISWYTCENRLNSDPTIFRTCIYYQHQKLKEGVSD